MRYIADRVGKPALFFFIFFHGAIYDIIHTMNKHNNKRKSITQIILSSLILLLSIIMIAMLIIGIIVHVKTVFEREKKEADHEYSYIMNEIGSENLVRIFEETKAFYEENKDNYSDEDMAFGFRSPEEEASFLESCTPFKDKDYERIVTILENACEGMDNNGIDITFYDTEKHRTVYVFNVTKEGMGHLPGQWEDYDLLINTDRQAISEKNDDSNSLEVLRAIVAFGVQAGAYEIHSDTGEYIGTIYILLNMEWISAQLITYLKWVVPLIILIIIVSGLLFAKLLRGRLIRPVVDIAKGTDRFAGIEAEALMKGERAFDELEVDAKTPREIEELIAGVKSMEESAALSMQKIHNMSIERERISAELSFASQIQQSMLPEVTDEIKKDNRFSLYATMEPAKEVGGDFYDFFKIDEDRLAFLIGDVSGKGVGAALFMAVSKSVIHTRVMSGGSPAKVLYDADRILATGNENGMFVTIYLAILNLRSGEVIACNAGHEPIALYSEGDNGMCEYRVLRGEHGAMVGIDSGVEFPEVKFNIKKGDRIFIYTDGVTEAKGSDNKQFGESRMINVLNENSSSSDDELLEEVKCSIKEFTKDEKQFDDITMLSVTYR